MGWFDGLSAALPAWSGALPQDGAGPTAPALMLQGTPNLIGAGDLQGFGGPNSSGMMWPATSRWPTSQGDLTRPSDPAASPDAAPPTATSAASDPSLFDRLSAAAHNFRPVHQGIIPGLFDAASGLMSGRRIDAAGQAQQTQNQTAAALQSRGLAPDVAEAVARNPDMMRQIAAQLFGPKQHQHVVVRDAQGNIVPLSFDASSGQYRDA